MWSQLEGQSDLPTAPAKMPKSRAAAPSPPPAGSNNPVLSPHASGVDPVSFPPVNDIDIWPPPASDGSLPPSHAVDEVNSRTGLMGDNLIDDLMVVEDESVGDAEELVKSGDAEDLVKLGDAEVGVDGKSGNFVDPSLQVEAMVRLLEEGFDRLKISVDVISTVTDDPEMMDSSGSVHPSQVTTIPESSPTPPNLSSFHKLDGIIRELTRKAKVGANPQDLISLTLLSDYNILREHLHIEGDPTLDRTAGLRIALCKPSQQQNCLTKGPWFARRLQEMANHVLRHHQLPERKQGKGGKHSSLLNQKEIYAAVKKFMNDSETGTVCLHLD